MRQVLKSPAFLTLRQFHTMAAVRQKSVVSKF
jgi:hypothetical protein